MHQETFGIWRSLPLTTIFNSRRAWRIHRETFVIWRSLPNTSAFDNHAVPDEYTEESSPPGEFTACGCIQLLPGLTNSPQEIPQFSEVFCLRPNCPTQTS